MSTRDDRERVEADILHLLGRVHALVTTRRDALSLSDLKSIQTSLARWITRQTEQDHDRVESDRA